MYKSAGEPFSTVPTCHGSLCVLETNSNFTLSFPVEQDNRTPVANKTNTLNSLFINSVFICRINYIIFNLDKPEERRDYVKLAYLLTSCKFLYPIF